MGKYDSQRAAYEFLLGHFLSGEAFVLKEFLTITGWTTPSTYRTYLSKQYRGLIENVEGGLFRISVNGEYRVTESFRRLVEWRKFRQHVTQNRPVGTAYYRKSFSKVLVYDFLMPLTHEGDLRMTLDALFYKETILAKLKGIQTAEIENFFPRGIGLTDDQYLDGILTFIQNNFLGYSIYHVDGRFRSQGILAFDQLAELYKTGRRYLIDETTAVTRFIFPYANEPQLKAIQFLFQQLFVRGMIQLVEGEQQIWMLENGPERIVHIWEAPDDDSDD